MSEWLVIVGSNVRNIVQSALKSGYRVYALTKFLDRDLKSLAKAEIIKDRDQAKVRAEELAQSLNAKVILGSGFEDLKVKAETLQSGDVKVVLDKLKFYKRLERLGIDFPELLSKNDDLPKIFKPRRGGGGLGVSFSPNSKGIVQRFVKGIPFSVTLLVKDNRVLFTSVNEILSGLKWLNAEDFKYCGNITPFIHNDERVKKAIEISKELVEVFDLEYCVGVDFILADKPYVLEVNPRFVGSLDTIEMSYRINVFDVLKGKKIYSKPRFFAMRSIVYADTLLRVSEVPITDYFADVPNSGFYEKGEPLISILEYRRNYADLIEKTKCRLKTFWRYVEKGIVR
jgi:predicted ATP-grasp superfamily ATP-dependent carboligase